MAPSRTPLRLDPGACDGCGRCVGACRKNALRIGPGYICVDWERCDGCGKCVDFCDRDAIALRDAPRQPAGVIVAPEAEATARPSLVARLRGIVPGAGAGPASGPAPTAFATKAVSGVSSREPAVAWSLPEAVLVLVVSFALLIGVQAIFGQSSDLPGTPGLLLLAYDSGLLALLAFFALRRRLSPWHAYHLDTAPDALGLLLALVLFIGVRLFVMAYLVAGAAAGFTPPSGEGVNLTALFGPGALGALATILVVGLFGPVLEEIALRGVVLGALRERIGPWPAVLVTALAFSLLHVSAWSFVPLTMLGLALGWLAVRGRSLWPAIVLHVAYNSFILAAAFRAAGG